MVLQGNTTDEKHTKQTFWLLCNKRLQSWLKSANTAELLINEDRNAERRQSLTSSACTTLIQSLSQSAECPVISFFCGLHYKSRGTSADGPQGLMQSLISQVLSFHAFDLSFIDHHILDGLQRQETSSLSLLFKFLVESLGEEAVLFCVIDDYRAFQSPEFDNDLTMILTMFSKLMADLRSDPRSPILKLLMTDSKSVKSIKQYFPSMTSMIIPVTAGDGRDISSSYLARDASKMLSSPRTDSQPTNLHHALDSTGEQESLGFLLDIGGRARYAYRFKRLINRTIICS